MISAVGSAVGGAEGWGRGGNFPLNTGLLVLGV